MNRLTSNGLLLGLMTKLNKIFPIWWMLRTLKFQCCQCCVLQVMDAEVTALIINTGFNICFKDTFSAGAYTENMSQLVKLTFMAILRFFLSCQCRKSYGWTGALQILSNLNHMWNTSKLHYKHSKLQILLIFVSYLMHYTISLLSECRSCD